MRKNRRIYVFRAITPLQSNYFSTKFSIWFELREEEEVKAPTTPFPLATRMYPLPEIFGVHKGYFYAIAYNLHIGKKSGLARHRRWYLYEEFSLAKCFSYYNY